MTCMTYVQRRANRYEFRFRMPDDLAGQPAPPNPPQTARPLLSPDGRRWKREIVRSLQTNDPQTANRRVLAHIAEVQAAIGSARRCLTEGPEPAELSVQLIEALASEHEIRIMSGDEALRRQLPRCRWQGRCP
jgi:hypothetical protein